MFPSRAVPLTCHGHSRPITHLSFSRECENGEFYVISACKDNSPMLRDGVTGDWIGTFIGHKGAVWQSRLANDASYAATGSADFTAKVWDTQTGECIHTLPHQHIVRAVAFPNQPNPQVLATGGFEKKLRIYDLGYATSTGGINSSNESSPTNSDLNIGSTSAPWHEIGSGVHGGTIKSIVWGSDNNTLISAADDHTVRWWDIRARAPVAARTLEGSIGSCEMNDLSAAVPYRDPVLSVAAGKSAYFFSGTNPGELIKQIKTPHAIASVAINAAERKFVVGGSDDTWVRIYSFDEEKELELHKGHHGPIWSVSFAPNGKLFATGSEDGTVKLWKFTRDAYGLWV